MRRTSHETAGAVSRLTKAAIRRLIPVPRFHDAVAAHKFEHMTSRRRVDVVFCGTSQVLVGLNPAHATPAGLSGYNAALHRAVPTVSARWLEDVVLPALHPRTVVLGASLLDLNDQGRFHSEILARYSANPPPGRLRLKLHRHAPRALFDLDSSRLPSTRATALLRQDGFSEEFVGKGWLVSDAKQAMLRDEIAADFRLGGQQVLAVRAALQSLRRRHIATVLCELPVRPEFVELFPRGQDDLRDASTALKRVAAETGARYVTFPSVQSRHFFADPIHLNGAGAIAVSEMMRSFLDAQSD